VINGRALTGGHRGGKTSAQRDALIDRMLAAVMDDAQVTRRLTAWEVDFVESVVAQWSRTKQLTDKQFETLERIYAEKTA
jgi:hypothetical protein